MGCEIARRVQRLPDLASVAAVDVNPVLLGKNLFEVLQVPGKSKIRIIDKLPRGKAKVALHSTRSWLADIAPEIEALIRKKCHVISTAEELVFPVGKNVAIAAKLHRLAKRYGVVVVGAGVNPGFVLDYLPAVLCRATTFIDHIHALRVVDLSTRRMQLQKKTGVGMTAAQFNEHSKDPRFGHQGMRESLALLAKASGFQLQRVYTSIKPLIAEVALSTGHFDVAPGQVCGLEQTAVGYARKAERLRLEVRMVVGGDPSHPEKSYDTLTLQSDPPIRVTIPGGIAGEAATAAVAVNLIGRVINHEPGFYDVLSL